MSDPRRDYIIETVYRALRKHAEAKQQARNWRLVTGSKHPSIKRGTGRGALAMYLTDAVLAALAEDADTADELPALSAPPADPSLREALDELQAFAEAHHGDEDPSVWLHGLTIDVPARIEAIRGALSTQQEADYRRGWTEGDAAADEAIRVHAEGPGHHYSLADCRAAAPPADSSPDQSTANDDKVSRPSEGLDVASVQKALWAAGFTFVPGMAEKFAREYAALLRDTEGEKDG